MFYSLSRFKGAGGRRPPHPKLRIVLLAGLGGGIAIAMLVSLGAGLGVTLLLGSFGASCVLLFGYPEAVFAQPANVIGGHLICTAIGLALLDVCGAHAWSLALAVGLSLVAMMATRTTHPPAGSNPVIVFLAQPAWSFIVFPVLSGAVLLVLVALVYNNVVRKERYPTYW